MYKLLCLRALFFILSLFGALIFLCNSKKNFALFKHSFDTLVETCIGNNICSAEETSRLKLSDRGPFSLKYQELSIEPPCLKEHLCYVNANKRPDLPEGSLYIKLTKTGDLSSFSQNSKLFLVHKFVEGSSIAESQQLFFEEEEPHNLYNKIFKEVVYYFSPDNAVTPLWLEIENIEGNRKSVQVRTCLKNSDDAILKSESFVLPLSLGFSFDWLIDNIKVDASILMKQQALWHGKDLFLKMYGGEDFFHLNDRERISFVDDHGITYSRYLGLGDYVVWKNGRWQEGSSVNNSSELSLLSVKRIDEKFIVLELISPFGFNTLTLNLIKYPALTEECSLFYKELSYVGLKNWGEAILKTRNDERIVLTEGDWLFRTADHWKILNSLQDIDAYIEGNISAPLFIFQEIQKKRGSYVLKGVLFNSSRTYFENVELALYEDSEDLSIDILQNPVRNKKDVD